MTNCTSQYEDMECSKCDTTTGKLGGFVGMSTNYFQLWHYCKINVGKKEFCACKTSSLPQHIHSWVCWVKTTTEELKIGTNFVTSIQCFWIVIIIHYESITKVKETDLDTAETHKTQRPNICLSRKFHCQSNGTPFMQEKITCHSKHAQF